MIENGPDLIRRVCQAVERCEQSPRDAIAQLTPQALAACLVPAFEPSARVAALSAGDLLTRGQPAHGGAASGRVAFSAQAAEALAERGEPVLLATSELVPEEVGGVLLARGILTARGDGACLARALDRPCVAAGAGLQLDAGAGRLRVGERVVREGEPLSIDGASGEVFAASLPVAPSEVLEVLAGRLDPARASLHRSFCRLLEWCDELARLRVRASVETPDECREARALGAAGVGLVRTEQMFIAPDRLPLFQALILAEDRNACQAQLARLLPLQREAFTRLFAEMPGLPVTIRTFDPPLHEFLPSSATLPLLAEQMGLHPGVLAARVEALRETNPMLGARGCRLGIAYPEITTMQARAIFEAARAAGGACPEILVPMVGHPAELAHQVELIRQAGDGAPHRTGAMIELPRAALVAAQLAPLVDFFSFGANDLTQMTLGLSRDDAGPIVERYLEAGIYPADPFRTLDTDGVGALIEIALQQGRAVRPDLVAGLCGEQAADPASIAWCHRAGLDHVSVAPRQVPAARLAAAQAAIEHGA